MAKNDINVVTLVGRLTKHADLRFTPSGMAISEFSVAVNYMIKKNDTWEEVVNFFNVQIFGKRAEGLQPYLTKGQQVGVMGELRQHRWEKSGQHFSRVYIIARQINLLGGTKSQTNQPNQVSQHQHGQQQATQHARQVQQAQQQDYQQPQQQVAQPAQANLSGMPGPEAFDAMEDIPF